MVGADMRYSGFNTGCGTIAVEVGVLWLCLLKKASDWLNEMLLVLCWFGERTLPLAGDIMLLGDMTLELLLGDSTLRLVLALLPLLGRLNGGA